MISHVTIPTQSVPTADNAVSKAPAAAPSQKPAPTAQANAPAATVQISNAAQVALKETLETPAQTAKEALGGDRQAQRLLAKEVAVEKG